MKLPLASTLCALLLLPPAARATDADVDITGVARKFANKGTRQQSEIIDKSQDWGYTVTVENKTFGPLSGLEVKYVIFCKREEIGKKGPGHTEHTSGSYTINSIPPNDKVTFDTKSINLTMSAVADFYYYPDGGKIKAQDALTGLWVRIYKNGTLFAEFAKPSGISSKENWDDLAQGN